MIVIVGAPFSGKGQYVRAEVARREKAGEVGLIVLDWTALYASLVWGAQSSYRDALVAATGATRLVSYLFEVAINAVSDRGLNGYCTTQSPRRALELADKLRAPIIETQADESQIAERMRTHLDQLKRLVPRARVETPAEPGRAKPQPAADGKCTQSLIAYYRELDMIAGKARGVKLQPGKPKRWTSTGKTRAFDRELWRKGLTPDGRRALVELEKDGKVDPGPAAVMKWLVNEKRRAA